MNKLNSGEMAPIDSSVQLDFAIEVMSYEDGY